MSMGDHKHRRHRRHRSTVGHIVGGIGSSLAIALQHASHAADHSLKSTDIVKAALTGAHRNHHPNHSSCQELYPRQQYHHYQHQQQYQPEPQNTSANPPLPSAPSVSTAYYYNEPPPAYSEAPPAYYSDSLPAYSALPPPYTASTLLETGALSVTASTEQAPAYTSEKLSTVNSVKVPAYRASVLVYPELTNVYVKPTPTRAPLVHGEEVPVYGFPPCYHYKYTDGCKYCLKWKWS